MGDTSSVFLVIDNRFGIVFASLDGAEASADLNDRVLKQAADPPINPGSFHIKSVKLGSEKTSGSARAALASHAQRLLQINAETCKTMIDILTQQNEELRQENSRLMQELVARSAPGGA